MHLPYKANFSTANLFFLLSFFGVDLLSIPIPGFQGCNQFGLAKKIESMAEPVCSRETVLHEYKDVFEGLGCMPQEFIQ